MQNKEQFRNSSTIAKLDEVRNLLALLTTKHTKLAQICEELRKYRLDYTASQLHLYLEEHPITRFEKEMAKNLEDCFNDFEHLLNAYCKPIEAKAT